MAISANRSILVAGGQSFTKTKNYSGDVRESQTYAVADSDPDDEHSLVIDITELQMFVIVSDQDILLQFNNATTGVPEISLKANVPFIELVTADMYHVSKFTVDITTLFLTNTSGSTANILIEVVKNNTP